MNKSISPLEALKRLYDYPKLAYKNEILFLLEQENLPKYYKIIETALKDYEKKTELAKEYSDVNNVAKRLKALEIIKEKEVNVAYFKDTFSKGVIQPPNNHSLWLCCDKKYERLTQEEYELLKEVLL